MSDPSFPRSKNRFEVGDIVRVTFPTPAHYEIVLESERPSFTKDVTIIRIRSEKPDPRAPYDSGRYLHDFPYEGEWLNDRGGRERRFIKREWCAPEPVGKVDMAVREQIVGHLGVSAEDVHDKATFADMVIMGPQPDEPERAYKNALAARGAGREREPERLITSAKITHASVGPEGMTPGLMNVVTEVKQLAPFTRIPLSDSDFAPPRADPTVRWADVKPKQEHKHQEVAMGYDGAPVAVTITVAMPNNHARKFTEADKQAAREAQEHIDHGRGDEDSGPDDCDCPCRGTPKQEACARQGCGFCIVAEKRLVSYADALAMGATHEHFPGGGGPVTITPVPGQLLLEVAVGADLDKLGQDHGVSRDEECAFTHYESEEPRVSFAGETASGVRYTGHGRQSMDAEGKKHFESIVEAAAKQMREVPPRATSATESGDRPKGAGPHLGPAPSPKKAYKRGGK